MGAFLSPILVAEDEGTYVFVLFDYDKYAIPIMPLFANVDKFKWFFAFIRTRSSFVCLY